jgi:hypothetical protein
MMLAHVTCMQLVRDSNLPGHCPVRVSLDFAPHLDNKMVYCSQIKNTGFLHFGASGLQVCQDNFA